MTTKETTAIKCNHCGSVNRINIARAAEDPNAVHCGECQKPIFPSRYTRLKGLKPEHYQHPLDSKARAMLQRIPGVDTVLKVLLREGVVKYHQLLLKQNSIELNNQQLKKYYTMMERSAGVLNIDKLPSLYITQSPLVNAYTFGADDHVIVLTTQIIDLLNDEELESVLAHELAHIHCDHVLYKTAARILSTFAVELASRMFGLAASVIYPIVYGLLYWDRTSELSADRAELLVNQSYRVSLSTLLKIAGGSQKLNNELSVDAFMAQAEQTAELTESSFLLKLYHIIQEANSTHHFATWRSRYLHQWAFSAEAIELMAGKIPTQTKTEAEKNIEPKEESIGIDDIVNEFKNLFNIGK